MKPGVVLLVDDEDEIRRSTAQALQLAGFTVSDFASAEAVLDYVTPGFNGVVVSDIRMPGMDGMSLLGKVRDIDADLPVILVTGHGDVQLAVRAMREGAYDFIEKPFDTQHLADVTARALDRRGLVLENRLLRAAAGKSDDLEARLPGRSPAMIDLRYRLRALAGTDADVLIVGETGVGKEVAARALHDISSRAARPFVAIDCAALPASLIESELFGHEAGAFPGALRPRYGKFEHARGGTLLLDEIGSMPADIQAKLLRVLEERVVVRLRLQRADPARRPLHRHQQGRAGRRGRGRTLPRRPLLSPQRGDAAHPAAGRPARGCRAALPAAGARGGRALPARLRPAAAACRGRDRPARLAGQCARAAQRRRPLRAWAGKRRGRTRRRQRRDGAGRARRPFRARRHRRVPAPARRQPEAGL